MSNRKRLEQYSVERLLEDESLTADLLDPAAKVLLDWGAAQAEALAGQAEDFDARLADLRRTLKRIARQAGQEATPEAQVERVQGLLAEVEAATGAVPTTKVVTTSRRRGRKCASR
jgi:uncharacterized membrane protein YccC